MHVVYVRASGDTGIAFHWDLPPGARAVSSHGSYSTAAAALADYRKLRDTEAAIDKSQQRLPL